MTPLSPAQAQTVRSALSKAIQSDRLRNSARLIEFLTYVVEESLAGRAKLIAGKSIAMDVYDRDPEDGSDNIVRVDARRLRRALAEYYQTEGQDDPVRITINSGGYAPSFDFERAAAPAGGQMAARTGGRAWGMPFAAATVAVIGLVVWISLSDPKADVPGLADPALPGASDQGDERLALADKSLTTLQAANLVGTASKLLFPVADPAHQKSAEAMFREAARIDPEFAGAYSGTAHTLASQALLAPNPDHRTALLSEATDLAARTVDLDPTSGWTVSAKSWVAFAGRDYDAAQALGARAYRLDPRDARVANFYALVLLLTGEFQTASAVVDPARARRPLSGDFAHYNVFGVASFHLGQYQEAIASFDMAIRSGGPVSELTLIYKAASYAALGQTAQARALLADLAQFMPGFPAERVLNRFYTRPELAAQVLDQLRSAGWEQDER